MTSPTFTALAAELETALSAGPVEGWSDGVFEGWARRCFAVQFHENPVYRSLCDARGSSPDLLSSWQDAPLVPATAFKHLDLVTGHPAAAVAVFSTSGTTRGIGHRGRHLVPRLSLYRASALANFAAHLLPDGERLPLVSLIPPPHQAPESSLSAMMGMVAEELSSSAAWVVDGSGQLDLEVLRRAARAGHPLLVAGTALAFVHLLEALGPGETLQLAPGTRVMETGGFKGRVVAVSRDDLYHELSRCLGVAQERIVNEYGMTELLSQLYEPVLREGGSVPRRHVPPPWLRVRALDPRTLEPMPDGSEGVLAFFDLANLGSVCHVLTEDLGSVTPEGVVLRGRAAGAEPRGCSRAMDELMAATGEAR
jgi:hypothetical protein